MQKVICDICEKKAADKHFKVKKEIETANFDMGFVFPKREWVHIDIKDDNGIVVVVSCTDFEKKAARPRTDHDFGFDC